MIKTLLGATASIVHVGSVTKGVFDSGSWDGSGDALDVLSIASVGDLVVIAFTFTLYPEATWSWAGMEFTDIYDNTAGIGYVGYRVVETGDTNPYVTGLTSDWRGLSVVASVFKAGSPTISSDTASGAAGMADPPSLTATGKLWVITGGMEGIASAEWGVPSGYTKSGFRHYDSGAGITSSTAIAYKIESSSSDTPGAFTESLSSDWIATTIAVS